MDQRQLEIFKSMTPEKKLKIAMDLYWSARSLKVGAVGKSRSFGVQLVKKGAKENNMIKMMYHRLFLSNMFMIIAPSFHYSLYSNFRKIENQNQPHG